MKTNAKTTIIIDAPAQDVFKYLVCPRYFFVWNSHLQKITPASLETLEKGSEYGTSTLMFGVKVKALNKVTTLIQNKTLCIENDTGLLHYTVDYSLKSARGSTILTCSVLVNADSKAFAFAKPILKPLAQRELQSDLDSLKFAVEQGFELA